MIKKIIFFFIVLLGITGFSFSYYNLIETGSINNNSLLPFDNNFISYKIGSAHYSDRTCWFLNTILYDYNGISLYSHNYDYFCRSSWGSVSYGSDVYGYVKTDNGTIVIGKDNFYIDGSLSLFAILFVKNGQVETSLEKPIIGGGNYIKVGVKKNNLFITSISDSDEGFVIDLDNFTGTYTTGFKTALTNVGNPDMFDFGNYVNYNDSIVNIKDVSIPYLMTYRNKLGTNKPLISLFAKGGFTVYKDGEINSSTLLNRVFNGENGKFIFGPSINIQSTSGMSIDSVLSSYYTGGLIYKFQSSSASFSNYSGSFIINYLNNLYKSNYDIIISNSSGNGLGSLYYDDNNYKLYYTYNSTSGGLYKVYGLTDDGTLSNSKLTIEEIGGGTGGGTGGSGGTGTIQDLQNLFNCGTLGALDCIGKSITDLGTLFKIVITNPIENVNSLFNSIKNIKYNTCSTSGNNLLFTGTLETGNNLINKVFNSHKIGLFDYIINIGTLMFFFVFTYFIFIKK